MWRSAYQVDDMTNVQALTIAVSTAVGVISYNSGLAFKARNPSLHRKTAVAAGLICLSAFLFTGYALVTTR